MSKHLGNRIGFGVSTYTDGGLFNLSSQYFLLRKQKWISKAILSGGNDIFSPGNGYTYTIFTSSGTLTISDGEIYIDYMIVAGGASGAPGSGVYSDTTGGGGGAGGFLQGNALFYPGSYSITIGGSGSNSSITGPSLFGNQTALTGGTGGVWPQPVNGSPGGSGGGGGGGINLLYGGNGTADQGTPGGDAWTGSFSAGGGGGAGGSGSKGTTSFAGQGGPGRGAFDGDTGIPPFYGTPGPTPGRWFSGGGNGGNSGSTGLPNVPGGGGLGGVSSTLPARNGTPGSTNTGGGGGGGAASPGGGIGGSGGSGIIILRYKTYT